LSNEFAKIVVAKIALSANNQACAPPGNRSAPCQFACLPTASKYS